MKETTLDVLIYLFDNCVEEGYEITSDQETLRSQLVQSGFEEGQIAKAFQWLEGLTRDNGSVTDDGPSGRKAFRVFNASETKRLDAECRGFILFLEQSGILSADDRELVVDRVMALDNEEIDLGQLKWIILMVLLNQPGNGDEFTWKEDFVMDDIRLGLH